MKLGRIFANAFARRIAYVVVGLLLAWMGLGDARAQSCPAATAGADVDQNFADEPAAYYACAMWGGTESGKNHSGFIRQFSECRKTGGTGTSAGYYRAWFKIVKRTTDCSTAQVGVESARSYFRFPGGTSCLARGSSTTPFQPLGGSTQCWNGCEVRYGQNGDDETSTRSPTGNVCGPDYRDHCPSGTFWNGNMGVCQPVAPDCPEGETRVDGVCQRNSQCPNGMVAVTPGSPGAIQQGALYCKPAEDDCPSGNVRSPTGQCLPGEGQCAAGEARRPNGTCGRDSDGDGEADDDDDRDDNDTNKPSASGGDSCEVPPSCSGGAIDCMQVKIQWRIDCNTRSKVNVSGGACNAAPVCVGENCKAMEYSQLLMQWRTACALEKLKIEPGEGGDGEKIKPDFEALAAGGDGADPNDSIFLPDGDGESFNEGLISYGASSLGWDFSVEGQQFSMPQQIKDWLPAIRWLIIAGATLVGIGIAWGKL